MSKARSHLHLIRMLSERLERISADSIWAHRASGIRGALLKLLEELENGGPVPKPKKNALLTTGFRFLELKITMEYPHIRKTQ